MITQKVIIYLAVMKKIGQYMPVPSRSKKLKRPYRKFDKVYENFQILYHRAYFVGVIIVCCCDLHLLLGERIP